MPLLDKSAVALDKVVNAPDSSAHPYTGSGIGLLLLHCYKGYGELMRNVFEEP